MFPCYSRLQLIICSMQKREWEGLGERVTCMTSGRHESRHEGGGARQIILRSFLQYFVQELETATFKSKRLRFVNCNDWACTTPSHLPDITHLTLPPGPFPSIFAYCMQAIKNWRRERPGKEASTVFCNPTYAKNGRSYIPGFDLLGQVTPD